MGRLNWGGLAIGAIAGLGLAAAISLVLVALGIGDSGGGDAAFALVQLFGLIAAGYVGGRFSPGPAPTQTSHGALAALILFGASAVIGLASGSDIAVVAIVAGGVVALVLGSVGGALSARRS